MQRFLPALAAVLLVVVGLGAGLFVLASRDSGSIEQTTPLHAATGPDGLPAGNIIIRYRRGADGVEIGRLAASLGAIDTPAARQAGQALVARHERTGSGVQLDTGATTFTAPAASDPGVAAFVRQHLGRSSR